MNNIIVTSHNCTISNNIIRHRLQSEIQAQKIIVTKCCFTNTFDNINNYYKFIKLQINGGDVLTIQLQEGYYDSDQLSSYLQSLLQLNGLLNCQILYSDVSNTKFIITSELPFNFVLFNDHRDQIYRYLGFSKQNSVFLQLSKTHIGDISLNVQLTTSLHLQMINPIIGTMNGILTSIPITVEYNTRQVFSESVDSQQFTFYTNTYQNIFISFIDIAFLDDNFQLLPINQPFMIFMVIN